MVAPLSSEVVRTEQGLTTAGVNLDQVRIEQKKVLNAYQQVKLAIETEALQRLQPGQVQTEAGGLMSVASRASGPRGGALALRRAGPMAAEVPRNGAPGGVGVSSWSNSWMHCSSWAL